MSKGLKKAVAIVAVVFMGLFVISLTMTLANKNLLNGAIGYVALFTGFIGIALYFVLWLDRRAEKKNDEASGDSEEGEGVDGEKSESESNSAIDAGKTAEEKKHDEKSEQTAAENPEAEETAAPKSDGN